MANNSSKNNIQNNIQLILVCAGTSCNDIVSSLQTSSGEGKSILSFYQTFYKGNLKKEPMPHLEEIGIKQIYNCRNNDYMKRLMKSLDLIPNIYSTFQLRTIESAMILGSQVANKVNICPLPGISKYTGISSSQSFKKLKSIFPPKDLSKKYWNGMGINKSFIDLKGSSPEVSFKVAEELDVTHSYSFSYGLNTIRKLIMKEIKLALNNPTTVPKTMIVVCEDDFIKDFLAYYYKSRSMKAQGTENIEYSSVWKFDLSTIPKTSSYFSSNKVNIEAYNKIYPTPYNYSPLKYEYPDKYTFSFFDKVYPLFKTDEKIPVYYIKFMHLTMCMEREKIKFKSHKVNNKKNNKTTAKKIIIEKPKYNNRTNYEKILENLTK